MQKKPVPWSKVPFVRLLFPLVAGIGSEWSFGFERNLVMVAALVPSIFFLLYFFLPLGLKYTLRLLPGICINLILFFSGCLLVKIHLPPELPPSANEHLYKAVLIAPPEEKENSIKLLASISLVNGKNNEQYHSIIYTKKNGKSASLDYGAVVLFRKTPENISNTGNPGSFDYKRFCLFEGIRYQLFLAENEYIVSSVREAKPFTGFIFHARDHVVSILGQFIPSPREQGLAQALLIGYKNDLDKDLAQAYANTGVIHVIAISGLHLGLIYGILLALTAPLKKKKNLKWARVIFIISGLWLFSLMAGAQPSVVRSAIMFSCIALAEGLTRKTSVYNSLAFSAFIVLCYNPFWLWDAGFQLSYAAVTSIITFYKPLFNVFYFSNRLIDSLWKISSVSISAQLLTLPLSIFHFHQFPLLFYFTNILAVPCASLILVLEVLLCAGSFLIPFATLVGQVIEILIRIMNNYVERFNGLSITLLDHLYINSFQLILLTLTISCFCFWLMKAGKNLLFASLLSFLVFLAIRSRSFYLAGKQQQLIVYNIPRSRAVHIIQGRKNAMLGEDTLFRNKKMYNFHIKPSFIVKRLSIQGTAAPLESFLFGNFRVMVMDGRPEEGAEQTEPDLVIVSGRNKPDLQKLAALKTAMVIIDASVPSWKADTVKKILQVNSIPFHDVVEKGAFLMKL